MTDGIVEELRKSSEAILGIDPRQIEAAAELVYEALKGKGQAIFMGNGGSSADAQHIAAELSGRYKMERPAMAGVCLSNIAPVTAIGNDYSYDIVFKRQVEAFARPGDAVVGMSTSGNSKNVILALERAKELGCRILSFTGPGGKLKDIADVAVIIPSTDTAHIQEGYLAACHIMCGIVEKKMFGRAAVLVDRDDTLCPDVPHNGDPAKMHVYPWVPAAVRRLNDAGLPVVMVTNQSGIGRGMFTVEDMEAVNAELMRQISESSGGRIDAVYFCPHRPDENCSCRKPATGMGLRAVSDLGLDPSKCWMVGDSDGDMEFGRRLGMHCIRVSGTFTFADAADEILGNVGGRHRTDNAINRAHIVNRTMP